MPVKPMAPTVSTPTPPTATAPTDSSGLYTAADLDTDACLRQRVVYFDFDKDDVKKNFRRFLVAMQNIFATVPLHTSHYRAIPMSAVRVSII